MNAFLKLGFAERQLSCKAIQAAMGLDAASVEKDFWVCWTLRELFALQGIGDHLTFKGGTSLSKAWKLIQRFSEDIDLIVDKEALGFGGDTAPDKAPSNKQRRSRLEALMIASREWVQGTLQPALAARIAQTLGDSGWTLEVDPEMPDGQCLLLRYPSAFETHFLFKKNRKFSNLKQLRGFCASNVAIHLKFYLLTGMVIIVISWPSL